MSEDGKLDWVRSCMIPNGDGVVDRKEYSVIWRFLREKRDWQKDEQTTQILDKDPTYSTRIATVINNRSLTLLLKVLLVIICY